MRTLRLSYAIPAMVLLCSSAWFADHGVSAAGLAVIAAVLGLAASVAAASFDSVLPHCVAAEHISRANAATETSRTVCVVVGPAAAGFAVSHLAPELITMINGITFAVALLLLTRMPDPSANVRTRPAPRHRRLGNDLGEGLRHVFTGNPVIRMGIIASTVVNLLFGAYEPMLVYRMRADMGVGPSTVGIVFAAAGLASITVAVLLSWKAPARGFMKVMGLAVIMQGLAVAAMAVSPSVAIIVIAQVGFVCGMLLYTVYWRALRQTCVPAPLVGRVAGTCRSIAYAGAFLGSAASAILLDRFIGVQSALLIAGAAVIVLGVTLLLLSVQYRLPEAGAAA